VKAECSLGNNHKQFIDLVELHVSSLLDDTHFSQDDASDLMIELWGLSATFTFEPNVPQSIPNPLFF